MSTKIDGNAGIALESEAGKTTSNVSGGQEFKNALGKGVSELGNVVGAVTGSAVLGNAISSAGSALMKHSGGVSQTTYGGGSIFGGGGSFGGGGNSPSAGGVGNSPFGGGSVSSMGHDMISKGSNSVEQMIQLQQQVEQKSEMFMLRSNIMKVIYEMNKNAINNMNG